MRTFQIFRWCCGHILHPGHRPPVNRQHSREHKSGRQDLIPANGSFPCPTDHTRGLTGTPQWTGALVFVIASTSATAHIVSCYEPNLAFSTGSGSLCLLPLAEPLSLYAERQRHRQIRQSLYRSRISFLHMADRLCTIFTAYSAGAAFFYPAIIQEANPEAIVAHFKEYGDRLRAVLHCHFPRLAMVNIDSAKLWALHGSGDSIGLHKFNQSPMPSCTHICPCIANMPTGRRLL